MTTQLDKDYNIAIIGAGPAGIYAAKELIKAGAQVALINRDVKPGGLAEYGIFPNKYKMKNGLRNLFRKALTDPRLHYFGNLNIGEQADFRLADLQAMGFDAVLVTVGAQGTKWLGTPGEDLKGVYHAKDLVYHYNDLPPFSEKAYPIGERVICIGVGNVMTDIANWCIRDLKIREVTAIARRGPADVKFTRKEMSIIFNNLDLKHLDSEFTRTAAIMEAVNQDVVAAKEFILSAQKGAEEAVSDTVFKLAFLASPKQIVGDEAGNVIGLEVTETTLELHGERTKAVNTGKEHIISADTIVYCVGDKVDDSFGLPLNKWNEYAKHPEPQYPQDEISYEAYDPETCEGIEGVFLAGWAREASTGLVGAARKDGTRATRAIIAYLQSSSTKNNKDAIKTLRIKSNTFNYAIVNYSDITKLEAIEAERAEENGLAEFKFSSNDEMLAAVGDRLD